MAIKHPHSSEEPVDNFDEAMHTAWINVMKQCFPKLIPKIETYHFRFEAHQQQNAAIENAQAKIEEIKNDEEEVEEEKEKEKSPSPPPPKRLRERKSTNSAVNGAHKGAK